MNAPTTAPDLLWQKEVRHHALSLSEEMHGYFDFLHRNGWFDDVVGFALDQVLEYLPTDDVAAADTLEHVRTAVVQEKPEQVGNAVFHFLINDTLEKAGTGGAHPAHAVTYAYYWFRWRDEAGPRMRRLLAELPAFVEE
jgi:hypothetical protein